MSEDMADGACGTPPALPVPPARGSSPVCYLDEADPTYLGYLDAAEIRALLDVVLAAPWKGPGAAEVRRRLLAHRATLHEPAASAPAAPVGPVAERLRAALPRIRDDALHHTLRSALALIEARGDAASAEADCAGAAKGL